MSLTRAYFGELQASIEQDINQPVRQEIDAFFCAFREKVEQMVNLNFCSILRDLPSKYGSIAQLVRAHA